MCRNDSRHKKERGGGGKKKQKKTKHGHTSHFAISLSSGAPYLLLVLVLHAESLLDAVASLQEGLPLGSFCQDAHKQP